MIWRILQLLQAEPKYCQEEYTEIELQLNGLLSPLWFCYSSLCPHQHWLAPTLPHLFAPVKGKERQALDECTFDLCEPPLLLLLSFCHHLPSPLCWIAVRVLKAWSVRSAPSSHPATSLGSFILLSSASWRQLESQKDLAATQSLASDKKPTSPSPQHSA